ncbi:ribosomal protein L24E/outer membrane murein-binding lipoprotein Lpp [Virgibacillus halotolerans]|uniref:hypothetical protein n=1 Tax=Virgibacillus halotolerans TaxID=1071053 RepID=UPI00195FBB7C|nr:hypothetical protein [Virgibacillus halotolerans]MBM7598099.1 ribosomal protein L24E/outer membrane murein-binding lipoprotein Lpp [Virgibacillus halotolerans]
MYIEVAENNKRTGITPIRIVMHEIYSSPDEYNKNGISWKREYVEKQISTISGSPIVAEFVDDDFDMPLGHGDVYVDDDGEVYFQNSVVVGTMNDAKIENVEINKEMKTVLVGYGHLYNQRFPNFIKWIKEVNEFEQVKSSVEICASHPHKNIIYEDGWKEAGRVPMEYQYSGHAILSETPADDSAVLLEINKFKEDKKMSKELIAELNSKIDGKDTEINKLKVQAGTKDTELNELGGKLEKKTNELNTVIQELNDKKKELEGIQGEVNELREFKQKAEGEKLAAELNEKLSAYTDEEKSVSKDKIETFSKSPSAEKVSEIVNEINSDIAKKIVEDRKKKQATEDEDKKKRDKDDKDKKSEQNSYIFGDILEEDTESSIDELL